MSPDISADLSGDRVELSTIMTGNASLNNNSVAKLESMVASEYHTQKSHARVGISEEAQPVNGRDSEKTSGEGRSRDGDEAAWATL